MDKLGWPFLSGRTLSIEHAEDIYLYDDQGRQIIDAAGGAIVANIGHGRKRVVEAIAKATQDTSYVVPTWLTPSRRAMLDVLAEHWLPPHLTRVHCTSGGTEANEAAMKMALQYQQACGQSERTKIIGRSVSYHGTAMATASISGHPARKRGLEAALPKFLEVPTPYPLRCPLGAHNEHTGAYYADLLQDIIDVEGADNIAAFLAEPITGSSGGAIVPPDDYWPKIQSICRDNGILLILDEVMTGFGRTGLKFGYQHWPVEPDILVSGKGFAGGYAPLGGVFATARVADTLQEAGFQVMFNTFAGHPGACAAAAEVLSIMVEEKLVEASAEKGQYLHNRLNDTFANHPHVAEVRGRGLFAAIEVVQNRETLERCPASANISAKIVAKGLTRGVFYYGGGTGDVRDIVCMGPAFTITEAAIDEVVDTLSYAVDEAMASA